MFVDVVDIVIVDIIIVIVVDIIFVVYVIVVVEVGIDVVIGFRVGGLEAVVVLVEVVDVEETLQVVQVAT